MSNTAPTLQLVAANHFVLSGVGIHVVYAPFVEAGLPSFSYQDSQGTQTFRGEGIEVAETMAGKVVSVRIRMTIDSGSTSFSVVVPRVQVPLNGSAPLVTDGITTIHHFSVVQAFNRGQLDVYSVTPLRGTASHVLF